MLGVGTKRFVWMISWLVLATALTGPAQAGEETKSFVVTPGTVVSAVFTQKAKPLHVIANSGDGPIVNPRVESSEGPVMWIASGGGMQAKYDGDNGVAPEETWTVATLKGNFQPPPGYAGPPPEYTINARQAAVHIISFSVSHTSARTQFSSNGLAGNGGGVMTITYESVPPQYYIVRTETDVPLRWNYLHSVRGPLIDSFEAWIMGVSYVAPQGGVASDEKRS